MRRVPSCAAARVRRCSSDWKLIPAPATRALLRARVEPAQVGRVNGRLFLVNASLGLYPQLLEGKVSPQEYAQTCQMRAEMVLSE